MKKLTGVWWLFLISVLCSSCARDAYYSEQFQYTDDGKAKPRVALIPVFDHSNASVPWNLSDELSEAIFSRFQQSGKFFLTTDLEILGRNQGSSAEINPFIEDLQWIHEAKSHSEFVVFVEVVEHRLIPKSTEGGVFNMTIAQSYTLDISIRVKVVDIREAFPKVILQELQHQSFHIPWQMTATDYKKEGWGRAAFYLSPIGAAHGQMIKKITKQIQDYILLAKSN